MTHLNSVTQIREGRATCKPNTGQKPIALIESEFIRTYSGTLRHTGTHTQVSKVKGTHLRIRSLKMQYSIHIRIDIFVDGQKVSSTV